MIGDKKGSQTPQGNLIIKGNTPGQGNTKHYMLLDTEMNTGWEIIVGRAAYII